MANVKVKMLRLKHVIESLFSSPVYVSGFLNEVRVLTVKVGFNYCATAVI